MTFTDRLQKSYGGISKLVLGVVCVALLVLSAAFAHAEDTKSFRTARLTYMSGSVRAEQAGIRQNAAAVVNMPLVEGAVLSTGEDGEAEIEFEDGSLVRMTPNSGVGLVNLGVDSSGDYQTRVGILGGLVYLELRGGTKYRYTIDAGGDSVSPTENTTLRINFDEPPAVIAVLDGTAHLIAASGSNTDATSGQTIRADATSEGSAYMVKQAIATESWDQWNEDRDAEAGVEAASETDVRSQYAGDQGYGWSDLDANGDWYDVPGEGEIWQPDIAAQQDAGSGSGEQSDFDPYGYGNWSYTPAGYVWASGYGWGWLPYRCGIWNYWNGFGWGWSPGVGCSAFCFGGYSGGGIHIGHAPGYYKRPGRPVPKSGPIYPVLRGRGGPPRVVPVNPVDSRGAGSEIRARVIAGNTVMPLPRNGTGSSLHRIDVGSVLRRDYPVDEATHAPVLGIQAPRNAYLPSSNSRAAWGQVRSDDGQGLVPGGQHPIQRPSYGQPVRNLSDGGVGRQVPVIRSAPAPYSAPSQRQAPPSASRPAPASAPRQAPAPAPASHPAAAPSPHGK